MKNGHKSNKYLLTSLGLFLTGILLIPAVPGTANVIADVTKTSSLSEEVFVPAGEFIRGCTDDVNNGKCDNDAKPLNAVYIDAFYIDKTEVTNAQYTACVSAGNCRPPTSVSSGSREHYYDDPQYANYPVINVDWNRATEYCQWLGKRLPTEAEWEKTARGTDLRVYPWGNEEPTCERLNYTRIDAEGDFIPCLGDTTAVGSYPQNASPYGALDMAGNVREWVKDLYARDYYRDAPHYNPQGPETTAKGEHLVRGGAWADHKLMGCNVWVRIDESDIYKNNLIGFRCARSAGNAPTPTPTPTPVPAAMNHTLGPNGGLVWQAYQDHLTVVHVPAGAVDSNTAFTITYDSHPDNQDTLQGIDHFFSIGNSQPTAELHKPLQFILGYDANQAIVADTLDLYRLQSNSWVTSNITVTEKSAGHFIATITEPGIYGLLGETKRFYLPLVIRAGR